MKDFLLPSGVAYFPDNYMELLRAIHSIDGTLDDEHTFHCVFSFPQRRYGKVQIVVVHGRLYFAFRCKIERREDTCKISYKVYPTAITVLSMFFAVCVMVYGFVTMLRAANLTGVLAMAILSAFLVGLFFVARRSCIRQFVQKFEGYG